MAEDDFHLSRREDTALGVVVGLPQLFHETRVEEYPPTEAFHGGFVGTGGIVEMCEVAFGKASENFLFWNHVFLV